MGLLGGMPYPLGGGSSSSALVATTAEPWDIKIGDLKFMLAAGPENPLIRRGAEYRTQQINFSNEPGEQNLGFWWQRSQSTWHYGTGNPTFDGPGSGDPEFAVGRFADSFGVEVWTSGEISLLPDSSKIATLGVDRPIGFVNASMFDVDYVYWCFPALGTLRRWNGSAVDNIGGSWSSIGSIASDGSVVWILDANGNSLWGHGDIDGNGDPYENRELYTGMPTANNFTLLRFAKQRLVAAYDNALYEVPTGITATTAFAGTPFFTHPKDTWVWTDVCEGPGAIYASGYSGSTSGVYKFVLDDTGEVPVLSQGILAVEAPAGETIWKLYPYIGSFIAIGTSAGVRVCSFNGTDIALAPITVPTEHAVQGITGWGDFLYCAVEDAGEGFSGLAKIDLSKEVEAGRYAWANDLRANSSTTEFVGASGVTGAITTLNGRPIYHVREDGIYARQNTRRTPSGTLTSGRFLFGTADQKHFLRLGVSGTGQGTVEILTGVNSSEATLSQIIADFEQNNDVDLALSELTGNTLALGVTLNRSVTDSSVGPTVNSVGAKALPAQPRERQWILPLRAYDAVEDQTGSAHYQSAAEVIDSLEQYVRTQEPVLLQTFFGDPERDWRTVTVHVEDVEYRQVQSEAGWGGVLTVSLRTIEG